MSEHVVDAFRGRNQPQLIPDSHLTALSPATYYLREWDEYLIESPLADRVLFGSMEAECLTDGLFRYSFKNQLGLTTINAFTAGKPLSDPLHVEVISPKFPTLAEHIDFYRSLLNDLFTCAWCRLFHHKQRHQSERDGSASPADAVVHIALSVSICASAAGRV